MHRIRWRNFLIHSTLYMVHHPLYLYRPALDPFLRACFCVELFCERGLLRREIRDEEIRLRLCSVDEKVDLEQSPYWTALQEYIRGK